MTILAIGWPVNSAIYLSGPSSLAASLSIWAFKIFTSSLPIESVTASILRLIASLSPIVVFNSAWSARLAELDVDMITCSASLSYHDTWVGLDNDTLKSEIVFTTAAFSILRSDFCSSNLTCFCWITATCLSKNSDCVAVSW